MADSNPGIVTVEPVPGNNDPTEERRVLGIIKEALGDYLKEKRCCLCCCPCCVCGVCCSYCNCKKMAHIPKRQVDMGTGDTGTGDIDIQMGKMDSNISTPVKLIPDLTGTTLIYSSTSIQLPDYTLYLCTDTGATRNGQFSTKFLYAWPVKAKGGQTWCITSPDSVSTGVVRCSILDITTQVNSGNPVTEVISSLRGMGGGAGLRDHAFQWIRSYSEDKFEVSTPNQALYWEGPDGPAPEPAPAVRLIPNNNGTRAELTFQRDLT